MPFSVRLDKHMEDRLTRVAVRSNRSVSDVVREALELYVAGPEPKEEPVTPYDRIVHLIGRVDTGGASRSERTGRAFAARLKARTRARRTD